MTRDSPRKMEFDNGHIIFYEAKIVSNFGKERKMGATPPNVTYSLKSITFIKSPRIISMVWSVRLRFGSFSAVSGAGSTSHLMVPMTGYTSHVVVLHPSKWSRASFMSTHSCLGAGYTSNIAVRAGLTSNITFYRTCLNSPTAVSSCVFG